MKINNDPVYVRRRRVALAVLVIVVALCLGRLFGGDSAEAAKVTASPTAAASPSSAPAKVEQPAPEESPAAKGAPGAPSDTTMTRVQRITGELPPSRSSPHPRARSSRKT